MKKYLIPFRIAFPAGLAGASVLLFFGCVAAGGGEYVETDTDYGYTGPWVYGGFEGDGYAGARPPYEDRGGDHRAEPARDGDHRGQPPARQGQAPGRNEGPSGGHAPAPVRNNPRPPPSIPNNPRPSGGGGASHGGGGGSRPSGGGNNDKRK